MADLVTKLTDIEAEQSEIRTRTSDLSERLNKIELERVKKSATTVNGKSAVQEKKLENGKNNTEQVTTEPIAKKSNAKLNALREIEEKVQLKWENEKIFEENAPETKM
jgi:chromosome segregation ATPase